MGKLSSLPLALAPLRATATPTTASSAFTQQVRHATFIRRPRRPYTFTQLIQLSDGSAYTVRTTSPQPIYRSDKDTRNTLLWQPSEKTLHNVELDEAGKLAAFRGRFGRGFDAAQAAKEAEDGASEASEEAPGDDLSSLITGYAAGQDTSAMRDVKPKVSAGGKKKR
ncbi:hypothetical protein B0I35DRAFT_83827 [Stachybotrys elegans]|uniref:Ribosomal protein bL31m N-terminal domain-containing protein n=1 Tax=Stachybotrys elegans TaxID=80388 RepID=A0A8K0SME5_9HYPO|nr:hypothetical protein B0I35DRAFT_83827 [Stachybotrys elegans]